MKITLELDQELIRRVQELAGIQMSNALLNEALKALIERESARRLARLGGTMPGLNRMARRREVNSNSTNCHSERSSDLSES